MNKLYKTTVDIYSHRKYSSDVDKFEVKEVEVLGENEDYLVLNDHFFTKLQKSKKGYAIHSVLGKESINIRDGSGLCGDVLGRGVFYVLYSYSKKRPGTIKKEIEKAIQDKYGWMTSIDLSVIK